MKERNPHAELDYESVELTGQDTDGSGDIEVNFTSIRNISGLSDVGATTPSGYTLQPETQTGGNSVKFRVYESAGSNAEMTAVTSSISIDVNAFAYGQ